MNTTLETLRSLRSIHGDFSDRRVAESELTQILQTAIRAANASNRQSYSIVVVDDPTTMKELTGYAGSHTLVCCVDFTRLHDTAARLGDDYAIQGMPEFIAGAIDISLVAQTAVVAARSLGIDSLLTNGLHRGDIGRIYRMLDLPDTLCFPLVAVVLGYAAREPAQRRGRLDGAGVIHRGAYRHATSSEIDDIVRCYDDPEAGFGIAVPWSEQGFAHYLDWFFQIWSKRLPASPGRSQLAEILERSGFLETPHDDGEDARG